MTNTKATSSITAELQNRYINDAQMNAILEIIRDETPSSKPESTESSRFCLCGCGTGITSKANFRPGHDSRTKGYISRGLKHVAGDEKPPKGECRVPSILVDFMEANPDFEIYGYDLVAVSTVAEEIGTF